MSDTPSDPDEPPRSDPSHPRHVGEVDPAELDSPSYDDILKSSALVGGASILIVAIGIVRTKLMAVLLGPAGFGLMGLFGSIADLAAGIAGMGLSSSGVRQIAEAVGTGDSHRIARTVTVLRRVALLLGILGAIILAVLSRQVSTLTFGSDQHAGAVALLSLVVLFRLVADGQGAVIQGMRRIPDLAKMGVLGGIFGTLLGVPFVYFLGLAGVVPYLICVAAMAALFAGYYSRKAGVQPAVLTGPEFRTEAADLLKFGLAFMLSGFLMMAAAYAVRTMVLREIGLEAAGFYQAAWTLGGLYIANILQAMGADFYPRLVAAAQDNSRCNRLVNEQEQVSLLLAGPGVIATLTFAPLIISLFYSANFAGAVEVLRWICLGMALRVISWPMGFVIMAKGERILFFGTELAWTVFNVGLTWVLVKQFGLNGAGIAFFAAYIFHALLLYPIVRHLSGFRWSRANRKTGLVFLSSIAVVFGAFHALPMKWATVLGAAVMIASAAHSIRVLLTLTSADQIPRPLRRFIAWLR